MAIILLQLEETFYECFSYISLIAFIYHCSTSLIIIITNTQTYKTTVVSLSRYYSITYIYSTPVECFILLFNCDYIARKAYLSACLSNCDIAAHIYIPGRVLILLYFISFIIPSGRVVDAFYIPGYTFICYTHFFFLIDAQHCSQLNKKKNTL